MKKIKILLLFIACANIFSACKKDKTEATELSKLPADSQTGANTFGCLVNGMAWVAQTDCKFVCDAPFKVLYDGSLGGNLFVKATRNNTDNNLNDLISLAFDSSNFRALHIYSNPINMTLAYKNYIISSNCNSYISYDSSVATYGRVNLTKYDLQAGIVSGTFEIQLKKIGCETISITNGRFDKKL